LVNVEDLVFTRAVLLNRHQKIGVELWGFHLNDFPRNLRLRSSSTEVLDPTPVFVGVNKKRYVILKQSQFMIHQYLTTPSNIVLVPAIKYLGLDAKPAHQHRSLGRSTRHAVSGSTRSRSV
jgi:hypothetical protein